MNDWKHASKIALLELKMSGKGLLGLLFIYIFYTILILMILDTEEGLTGVSDILLVLLFSFTPSWCKPKEFQYQKIGGSLWASPSVVMLNHLPISKDTVAKSRLVLYFFYSFPIQGLFLLTLYILANQILGPVSGIAFLSFSIFWLSFGVWTGFAIASSDVGMAFEDKGRLKNIINITIIAIVFLLLFVGLIFIPIYFEHGIVKWTYILAENFPLLTIILSLLLAIIAVHYYIKHMKKAISKVDYL